MKSKIIFYVTSLILLGSCQKEINNSKTNVTGYLKSGTTDITGTIVQGNSTTYPAETDIIDLVMVVF